MGGILNGDGLVVSSYGGRIEKLAGALGIEPRMAVPKTAALPLGYAPAGAGGALRPRVGSRKHRKSQAFRVWEQLR